MSDKIPPVKNDKIPPGKTTCSPAQQHDLETRIESTGLVRFMTRTREKTKKGLTKVEAC